jgi:hypothetical protein
MQALGGCQTSFEAHFATSQTATAKSVEVPILRAQPGKYAPKICVHLTRGGCGRANNLPNVWVRGFAKSPGRQRPEVVDSAGTRVLPIRKRVWLPSRNLSRSRDELTILTNLTL